MLRPDGGKGVLDAESGPAWEERRDSTKKSKRQDYE